MTFEKLQYPPRSDMLVLARSRTIESALSSSATRRGFLAGSVAALSVSLFVFASPKYAKTMTMTTSDTGAVVVATAADTGQAAEDQSPRSVSVPSFELHRCVDR